MVPEVLPPPLDMVSENNVEIEYKGDYHAPARITDRDKKLIGNMVQKQVLQDYSWLDELMEGHRSG